jgi:hypothetical protein
MFVYPLDTKPGRWTWFEHLGVNEMAFEEGQRVKFYGTHDKSNQFTGTIVHVHEDSDLVDIAAEPDGKAIEVETILTAHATDVTPLEE